MDDTDLLFVKPNIRIEGLVDQFVGWLHLLAPVPAAMNLANLQLPMLDSYLQRPEVHAAAVANPKMKGGFFVDVHDSRIEDVRALRERMRAQDQPLLALAEAVREADNLLRAQATGYDLTPLYPQLPAALRGYVELVYDVNHHPSMRVLESLLYRSPYHRESRQSIQLSLDDGATPPFILSTPRLAGPDHLQLPVPLRHPGIDALFGLRTKPQPFSYLRDALEVSDGATAEQLRRYLTADPCLASDRELAEGGRIRYFGHACLLFQSPSATIIVDPFISSDHAAGDRFTYVDLPDHIDLCLITHGHQDHIVLESLLQLRGRIDRVIVPRSGSGHRQDPSLRLCLERLGFRVQEVDDLEELPFPGGRVVATPFLGEHCDLDIRAKTSYWIDIAGRRVFVGADTSGLEADVYARVREAVGATDIAFIGMECDGAPLTWLYSALFTQPVPRKMALTRKLSGSNAEQATGIVDRLGATEAYVYAMGQEPWLQHVMATSYTPESYQLKQVAQFLESCRDRGVVAEHLLHRKELRW